LPEGFTAKGITALVFSCIAGILGMAAVVWYGIGELGEGAQGGVVEKMAGGS
jgi:iron transport multicopper oxidase